MKEEVALTFHFPPSELDRLSLRELHHWHAAARRHHKRLSQGR